MEISIKAYLKKSDDLKTIEIRRVGLDKQSAKSYQHLVDRLVAIFPSLTTGVFTTAWKDDEDEMITFSTDEEYEIALRSLKEGELFRIYIKEKIKETKDTELFKTEQFTAKRKFRCANHCLEVEEEPICDGFGRPLCSDCFYSSFFLYECKKCHNVQHIKYNLKPENTWFCHNACQTWTHWQPVPSDTKN